jgi:hypothetical protein
MMRYEYDDDASSRLHMDVVHEAEDATPTPVARWVHAMRRLNAIDDPLARKLVRLHLDCGSGTGECDAGDDRVPMDRRDWGCATTALIAEHFAVEYPGPKHR